MNYLRDYLQHFRTADLGQPIFRVIDGIQHEPDPRKRLAALVLGGLIALDGTVGVEEGLQWMLKALEHVKREEADEYKAVRDFVAEEIAK